MYNLLYIVNNVLLYIVISFARKNFNPSDEINENEEQTKSKPKLFRLSQPEIRYCIYMMEKYGDNYEVSFIN